MSLEAFVQQGWQDHAKDAATVCSRLPEGVGLASEAKHLPALAGLIVHVSGEHMGKWDEGLALLSRLEKLAFFDAKTGEGKAVLRSQAVLHFCKGDRAAAERLLERALTGGGVSAASDRIRILATASSALAQQKRTADAISALDEALALASYGPKKDDPAARALAVSGNNLACELEMRPSLTEHEKTLMLKAARAARTYWEVAGTWLEVERAEYRLAMSHLKAGEAKAALEHARLCAKIVDENRGEPGDVFYANEALARARLASGDRAGALSAREAAATALAAIADEEVRAYSREDLAKLDALLR